MSAAAKAPEPEDFRALFDPAGVVVAGASTHPGKFGFVCLHNILASGYAGRVFATIEPRAHLEELARKVRLTGKHRPGWFGCLLVGVETSGFCYLAPTSRADFERRAS